MTSKQLLGIYYMALPVVFWAGWLMHRYVGVWLNHTAPVKAWTVGGLLIMIIEGATVLVYRLIVSGGEV